MDLQASFGVLSEVIEQYESRGRSVRNVEATAGDAGERLRATLSIPVCPRASADDGEMAVTPRAASLTDGDLRVEFDLATPTPPENDAATVTVTDRRADVEETGDVVLTVELVIEPTDGGSTPAVTGTLSAADVEPTGGATVGGDEPSDDGETPGPDPERRAPTADGESTADDAVGAELAAIRDESVPPYDDEPFLERLYEVCDTFDEMRDGMPMDVSAETVRRYMIEADIHDPTTYDTEDERDGDDAPAAETDAESAVDPMATVPDEQLLADGSGLPAALSIEEVADAVVEASTMYEVRDRLDLDPRRTRELLQQLDLIDLVMRRIGDDTPREVTHETVANRLRECPRTEPDAPTAT